MFATIRAYLFSVAVAEDDALNVAAGGLDGMTVSARAGRARNDGKRWGCILCRFLDWLQPGHCDQAIVNDEARAKAVQTYLEAKGKPQ